MATFIRLKQIESGSALQQSAAAGTDFSASVNAIVSQSLETSLSQSIVNIIVNNVQAALPVWYSIIIHTNKSFTSNGKYISILKL